MSTILKDRGHMIKGSGLVVYDPNRNNMKRKITNWCVIEVDPEITRYYRWWVQKELWIELHQPAWDAHISCVRGEFIRPEFEHYWRRYNNQTVPFVYDVNVRKTGITPIEREGFWFIDVYCSTIDQIRAELGLKTFFKYHLTIGRIYP